MSVRALGIHFTSELHRAYLKARGFKKSGQTFRCERAEYTEFLQVQGSQWNSGQEPWRFYVNVLVLFKNLPDSAPAETKYHAKGRIDGIVSEAPEYFGLTSANFDQLIALTARLSEEASRRLPELLPVVRDRACHGLFSPIPIPDTWLKS